MPAHPEGETSFPYGAGGRGWGKGIYLFSFLKIGGLPAKRAMRAGKKKSGSECHPQQEFLSACFPRRRPGRGGRSLPVRAEILTQNGFALRSVMATI